MSQYRRIKSLMNESSRKAVDRLLSGKDIEARAEIERIKQCEILLSACPGYRPREFLLTFIVATLSLGAIWFLWSYRIPTTRIELTAEAKSVILKLKKASDKPNKRWEWKGSLRISPGKKLKLENFKTDQILKKFMSHEKGVTYHLTNGPVMLVALDMGDEGVLAIEYNHEGQLEMRPRSAYFSGRLEFHSTPDKSIVRPPEWGEFNWSGKGAKMPTLEIQPLDSWKLINIPVQYLSFTRRKPVGPDPGDRLVETSILGGTLRLIDIGQEKEVRFGDTLMLKGLEGRVVHLDIKATAKRIDLRFEGNVKRIGRGAEGFEEDLTPSLLEYWYYNKAFSFFLSLFIASWGFLWSLRKWILL